MSATATPQPPSGNHSTRRRQYYIKRAFQRRFILQFGALVAVGCVALGALLYAYSTPTLTTAFVHSKLRVMSTADFLLPALGFLTLLVTALAALAAAARLLLLSHKIAGPLYRLEQTAQAVGRGNISMRVRLRDGDELQDFANAMDAMVSELRTQVQQIQQESRRLRELIGQLQQQPTASRELLQALQATQERLEATVGRFQV